MSKIILVHPDNAPNFCFEVRELGGKRSVFVQSDWDYPGVAKSFGWPIHALWPDVECVHSGTDGTIDCPTCGIKAGEFIQSAYEWLASHEGATADDPGYFDE